MRIISFLMILLLATAPALAVTPVFAETMEASSLATAEAAGGKFLQQFDIVFWQTLPFAALWGHFVDRQLSSFMYPGSAAHWEVIVPFAIAVSATNALLHARRVTNGPKAVDSEVPNK